MDRTDTIISLAGAMGIKVQKEKKYNSKYDYNTGTYYCNREKSKNTTVGIQGI